MELFEEIRVAHRMDGLSIRELADRFHVHRRTVRDALHDPNPPGRKDYRQRARPVLGPWTDLIDEWLTADLSAPRKQRHTATRVHQRLVAEYGAKVGLRTVSKYVAAKRAELGLAKREVFICQEHLPGVEAEVDFGDIYVFLDGVETKVALFEMRLSASGKSFHQAFSTTGSEAFIEGHVLAFEHFGGVPERIRYDNLKPAVTKVLRSRERIENEKFLLLRSHYGFDSFFCRPGKDGAHEKGGVEGGIGYFRRNHLVPVPKVATLAALNELIAAADEAAMAHVIAGRTTTIGAAFAAEAPMLAALPAMRFDAAILLNPKVDSHSRIAVRQCFYSVPAYLVGRKVHAKLSAAWVEVWDQAKLVATHPRAIKRGTQTLLLDHYLEILLNKPGALPGSTALAQARAAGTFTTAHQKYWDGLRDIRGDREGTTAFIDVLLAHRNLPADALIAAMELAVESGALDPHSVIMDARNLHTPPLAPVIPITIGNKYDRPLPSLDHYDELLTQLAR